MSTKTNPFDFVLEKNEANLLGAGDHIVSIVEAKTLTDRISDLAGTPKTENLPPWSDETPQIALVYANKDGVITRRYSRYGYKKWNDLTESEKNSGKFTPLSSRNGEGNEEYACIKDKNGKFFRVISQDKSQDCISILSRVIFAVGGKQGESAIEALKRAIANKTKLQITVESSTFNDTTFNKVSPNVKPFSSTVKEDIEESVEENEIA